MKSMPKNGNGATWMNLCPLTGFRPTWNPTSGESRLNVKRLNFIRSYGIPICALARLKAVVL